MTPTGADHERMREALELVRAAMLRDANGDELGYGWDITALNRARPLIRAALKPTGTGIRKETSLSSASIVRPDTAQSEAEQVGAATQSDFWWAVSEMLMRDHKGREHTDKEIADFFEFHGERILDAIRVALRAALSATGGEPTGRGTVPYDPEEIGGERN